MVSSRRITQFKLQKIYESLNVTSLLIVYKDFEVCPVSRPWISYIYGPDLILIDYALTYICVQRLGVEVQYWA